MDRQVASRQGHRQRTSTPSLFWPSGAERERIRNLHDRPLYQDSDHHDYYQRRRYEEDDWIVRSPSTSSAAWASQPHPMTQAPSSEHWSHSRLPPPAHYDQRPPRDSSRRHGAQTEDRASRAGSHPGASRYLSTSHNGSSSYYASTSPSGVTPTTNSTSPSALSSSSTSTGSSLRTPPDLALLHGLPPGKAYEGNGSFRVIERRYLSVKEIEERLELLDSLGTGTCIETTLPSEPSLAPFTPAAKVQEKQTSSKAEGTGSSDAHKHLKGPEGEENRDNTGSSKMTTDVRNPPRTTSMSPTQSAVKRKSGSSLDDVRSDADTKKRKSPDSTEWAGDRDGKRIRHPSKDEGKVAKKIRPKKESSRTRDYDTPSLSPPPSESRQQGRDRQSSSSKIRPVPVATPSLPSPRTWTKEDFTRVANVYQARGRSLKHSGDKRVRSAPPSSSSSARAAEQRVANYEQTEAILLYMYAFWCEDHAATNSSGKVGCIPANWTSLSGLMHYVCANHEKAKDFPLAGLCRLLEALVLRHVASHEQKQLNVRLARLVSLSMAADPSSSNGPTGSEKPAGQERAAAGVNTPPLEMTATLSDLSTSLIKVVADEERCVRLLTAARSSLGPATLAKEFPLTWEQCLSCGILLDTQSTYKDLDPGRMTFSSSSSDDDNQGLQAQARWAWPLDVGSASATVLVPHLVNFARALLREAADRRGVAFSLAADLP